MPEDLLSGEVPLQGFHRVFTLEVPVNLELTGAQQLEAAQIATHDLVRPLRSTNYQNAADKRLTELRDPKRPSDPIDLLVEEITRYNAAQIEEGVKQATWQVVGFTPERGKLFATEAMIEARNSTNLESVPPGLFMAFVTKYPNLRTQINESWMQGMIADFDNTCGQMVPERHLGPERGFQQAPGMLAYDITGRRLRVHGLTAFPYYNTEENIQRATTFGQHTYILGAKRIN